MSSESKPLEILHIEDDFNDAFFFRNQMREVSVNIGRVVQFTNLGKSLEALHQDCAPDLVFLDLTLPDAWELEGLQRLLEAFPYLIVVVLTGASDPDLPLRALQAGAQDYIRKSELSTEILARVIRFALYRSEAQEALFAAVEDAKRANQAKSRFLANIGHELRTPLNVIMGFTELFEVEVRQFPDFDQKEILNDLQTVTHAQEHLLGLLNDLLDMAKIESGQMRLEPTNFSLFHLVENITALFRDSFENRGNQFAFEIRGNVPEELFGDPRRIRQLLVNLLSNANKFTQNGRIDMRVECRPSDTEADDSYELKLIVSDTGVGIAPEDHKRIFEYFQQVDDSNTRPHDGSGLGLTICRQLAHMMNGEIFLESELGKGSTFIVVLKVAPVQVDAEVTPSNLSTLASIAQAHGRRALVVEDDAGARRFVSRALKSIGLEVTPVQSAEEAALVGGRQFDFVILDLHLPGKDGLDLVRALRASQSKRPHVIISTGDRSEVVREKCVEEGIDDILFKPFAPRALCMRVLETMEQ